MDNNLTLFLTILLTLGSLFLAAKCIGFGNIIDSYLPLLIWMISYAVALFYIIKNREKYDIYIIYNCIYSIIVSIILFLNGHIKTMLKPMIYLDLIAITLGFIGYFGPFNSYISNIILKIAIIIIFVTLLFGIYIFLKISLTPYKKNNVYKIIKLLPNIYYITMKNKINIPIKDPSCKKDCMENYSFSKNELIDLENNFKKGAIYFFDTNENVYDILKIQEKRNKLELYTDDDYILGNILSGKNNKSFKKMFGDNCLNCKDQNYKNCKYSYLNKKVLYSAYFKWLGWKN